MQYTYIIHLRQTIINLQDLIVTYHIVLLLLVRNETLNDFKNS